MVTSPMTRAFVVFIAGWCALNLAALAFTPPNYSGLLAELFGVFRATSMVAFGVSLCVCLVAGIVGRWPEWRRVGYLVLPMVGFTVAACEFCWQVTAVNLDLPPLGGPFYGAALGLVAALALRIALGSDEPDLVSFAWDWVRQKIPAVCEPDFSLPPRVVTGFCLVQIICVFVGTFSSRWALGNLRRMGFAVEHYWPSLHLMSSFGFCFLLLTVAWCGWAVISAEGGGATPAIAARQFFAGLGLTVLAMMFLCAAPFVIQMGFGIGLEGPLKGIPQP